MDPAAALRPVVLPAGYAFDEDILVLDREPFRLHFGGELSRVEIAYRIAGADGAPVVAVLGGISAGRNVFRVRDGVPGWWDGIAGPGKALDTDRFRVLGIDFLGGSQRTTGPGAGEVFQSVSAHDQATCLTALMDHLGIAGLHGCIGASYGGMVTMVMGRRACARHRGQRRSPHASDVHGVA
jgi:homoserine O-acetyltransferase